MGYSPSEEGMSMPNSLAKGPVGTMHVLLMINVQQHHYQKKGGLHLLLKWYPVMLVSNKGTECTRI